MIDKLVSDVTIDKLTIDKLASDVAIYKLVRNEPPDLDNIRK